MDKSPKSVSEVSHGILGEMSNLSVNKCQENPEDRNCFGEEIKTMPEVRGSPELKRKMSRTIAVRDDARRLKTATLDRMGKMFKMKSSQAPTDETQHKPDDPLRLYDEEKLRKEKTKSLGRMLKLVDKNGESRKLFPHSRTGSLGRMFRRKSTGDEEKTNGKEKNSGVFSKMLNQWKHRSGGNITAEPNLCASGLDENDSSSTKPASTSGMNPSSSCAPSPATPLLPETTSPATIVGTVEHPAR